MVSDKYFCNCLSSARTNFNDKWTKCLNKLDSTISKKEFVKEQLLDSEEFSIKYKRNLKMDMKRFQTASFRSGKHYFHFGSVFESSVNTDSNKSTNF